MDHISIPPNARKGFASSRAAGAAESIRLRVALATGDARQFASELRVAPATIQMRATSENRAKPMQIAVLQQTNRSDSGHDRPFDA
jgi:hypothetical protein